MKIYWTELEYKLKTKWSSFTYLYRKPYYKLRLLYRLSKIQYWGTWEMVEPMLEIPFEMFCEFYEYSDIKNHYIIDVENEPEEHGQREFAIYQNKCYDEMDYLYKWYKEIRHERQEELDYLLHLWAERHVNWWGDCEDESDRLKGCRQWFSVSDRYTEYLHKLLNEEEAKFEREQEDALIRLIKLRSRLWD